MKKTKKESKNSILLSSRKKHKEFMLQQNKTWDKEIKTIYKNKSTDFIMENMSHINDLKIRIYNNTRKLNNLKYGHPILGNNEDFGQVAYNVEKMMSKEGEYE